MNLKRLADKIRFISYCFRNGPQRQPSHTYAKYPSDYNFNGYVLNLGCGNTTYDNGHVTNLDKYQRPGVNFVWDLATMPLPFRDEQFDLIIANHILEHVPNWWECFKECARVLKTGGKLEVWLPGRGDSQLGYRDHINYITACSFVGTRGTWRNSANAWEEEDRKTLGQVINLKLVDSKSRMVDYWWCHLLPQSMLQFIVDHTVNMEQERGFFFEKLPPEVKNGN